MSAFGIKRTPELFQISNYLANRDQQSNLYNSTTGAGANSDLGTIFATRCSNAPFDHPSRRGLFFQLICPTNACLEIFLNILTQVQSNPRPFTFNGTRANRSLAVK